MTVGLDDLRLAAALAHSVADADLELSGCGRRWLVSYGRLDATVDPCGFRQLVLTTMHGGRVGLLPAEAVRFAGSLRDIGGGIHERLGPAGTERRFATFGAAVQVEALLVGLPDAGDEVVAEVAADLELGVVVVVLAAVHPVFEYRLDVIAHRVVAALLVEELVLAAEREAAG